MSIDVRFSYEGLMAPALGRGTIEKKFTAIVNSELKSAYQENAHFNPTDIELNALGVEGAEVFEVVSWHQTASSEAPGVMQPHRFDLRLIKSNTEVLLEGNYFRLSGGERCDLSRSEALFFLGLSFRALAAQRSSQKRD
jgi:hypothetical protein